MKFSSFFKILTFIILPYLTAMVQNGTANYCDAYGGDWVSSEFHGGSEAQCNLQYFTCYQSNESAPYGQNTNPSYYILLAPGWEFTSDDSGGLLDLCNGNTGATGFSTNTNIGIFDMSGNWLNGSSNNSSLWETISSDCIAGFDGYYCGINANGPFQAPLNTVTTCTGLIYNDCSGTGSSCSYNGGSTCDSGNPVPQAVATSWKNWSLSQGVFGWAFDNDPPSIGSQAGGLVDTTDGSIASAAAL